MLTLIVGCFKYVDVKYFRFADFLPCSFIGAVLRFKMKKFLVSGSRKLECPQIQVQVFFPVYMIHEQYHDLQTWTCVSRG